MVSFWAGVLGNLLVAVALAAPAWWLTVRGRRPVIAHLLWILVLVKLLTPPLVSVHWLPAPRQSQVASSGDVSATPPRAMVASPAPKAASARITARQRPTAVPLTTSVPRTDRDLSVSSPAVAPPDRHSGWLNFGEWFTAILSPLLAVWGVGSLACLMRTVRRYRDIRRALEALRRPAPEYQSLARRWAQTLGCRKVPIVEWVDATIPPTLVWLEREPHILLPDSLIDGLTPAQTEAILVHELAHLRRGDRLVRWLDAAVGVIYWWLPFVQWARGWLHVAEEQCCDAWVVWALPDRGGSYAAALLRTVDFLAGDPIPTPALVNCFDPAHQLERRITMIQSGTVPHRIGRWSLLALLVVTLATIPFVPAWKGTEPKKSAGPTTLAVPYLPELSEQEIKIQAALDKPITFEFSETPLHDVASFIASYLDINVVLDLTSLEEAGIDPDTPVTVHLNNVRLRSALEILLRPLKMDYDITNDVLLLAGDQYDRFYNRIYLVGDLCASAEELPELVTLLETVEPNDWVEQGGAGQIAPASMVLGLSVYQSARAHRKIVALLENLRTAKASQRKGENP